WRQKVLQAFRRKEWTALEKLIQEPAVTRQPTAFLVLLGRVSPPEIAVRLWRRGQQQHPNDFWVNFELAYELYHLSISGTGACRAAREKPREVNEAIRFCTAALALRPKSPMAHRLLGAILLENRDLDGAIASFQMARQLAPKYAETHLYLGNALA